MLEKITTLQQAGKLDEALAACHDLLKTEQSDPDLWHLNGLIAAQLGKLPEAIDALQQAALLDPTAAMIQNHLGNAYRLSDKFNLAINHYQEALRLNPNFAEAYNNLGNIFYRQGDLITSTDYYQKALRHKPAYGDAHMNLANCYTRQDKVEAAASHYQAATETMPPPILAYLNLGLSFRSLHELERAIPPLWRYVEFKPEDSEARYFLALTYSEMGRYEEAIAQYTTLLEKNPAHEFATHNLATLYHKQGETGKALKTYNLALEINPENQTAQYMVAALTGSGNPTKAPAVYMQFLFDQYAENYNQHLSQFLNYQAPTLIAACVSKKIKPKPNSLAILDIGCGTGLMGPLLKPAAHQLSGIDLSSKMLKQAERLQCYDDLHLGDMEKIIARYPGEYDLIVAADVLIYYGDLSGIFKGAHQALRPKGFFCFTVEAGHTETYVLTRTGRFGHGEAYLKDLARQHHFNLVVINKVITREHEGTPVKAWLVLLKKES